MGKTKPRIHVRINGEQKENWKDYIEGHEHLRTLTDLVTLAVEEKIEEDGEPQVLSSPGFETDLDELQSAVEEIRSDVSWLKEQQQEDIDMSDVSVEVFEALKVLPQPQEGVPDDMDEDLFAARMVIHPDADSTNPQRAKDIAATVDMSPSGVEDAIEYLKEEYMLPVVEVEIDGQVHYFKEE